MGIESKGITIGYNTFFFSKQLCTQDLQFQDLHFQHIARLSLLVTVSSFALWDLRYW